MGPGQRGAAKLKGVTHGQETYVMFEVCFPPSSANGESGWISQSMHSKDLSFRSLCDMLREHVPIRNEVLSLEDADMLLT